MDHLRDIRCITKVGTVKVLGKNAQPQLDDLLIPFYKSTQTFYTSSDFY